jgi:tRNA(Ile)-lysidine synthase
MSTDSKFLEHLRTGLKLASVPNGATLIVAFSGGPDSSALLAGLANIADDHNYSLVAAHINHQIRSEASRSDQLAAQAIAESLQVEFVTETVDVPAIAVEKNISVESAARHARYQVLSQIAQSSNAYGVVTGHTKGDQAETVLLHATRGAGLKGISGMNYQSVLKITDSDIELNLLRPMLGTPRSECIECCEKHGISPVLDESNNSRDYTRNKIRLDVLPLLNQVTPGASDALARLADNVSDDLEIIDWVVDLYLAKAKNGNGSYSRSATDGVPASLVARMIMRAYETHLDHSQDLERTHVSEMVNHLSGRSGVSIELPNKTTFFIDKDSFGFASPNDDDCPFPESFTASDLQLPGTTKLSDGFIIDAEIVERPKQLDTGNSHITFATPDLLSQSLSLRNRKNGDRFQPLGMTPKVKLQDFFVGAGVPKRWRDRVPIVESGDGIIWIAGYRLAEWAKVLPDHTKVTRLELIAPLS